MSRRTLLIVAALVAVLTILLFLVSWFVQPLLPAPWNNVLILLGGVVTAVFVVLSGLADAFRTYPKNRLT